MFLSRFDRLFVLICLTAGAAMPAAAASILSNATSALLGRPLDFAALVRTDDNEPLAPECFTAEVSVGDRPLAPEAVRTVVEQQRNGLVRLRVRTVQSVDEPVVAINLRVGCNLQMARRFVVFADPPALATSTVPAFAANPPAVVAAAAVPAAVPLSPPSSAASPTASQVPMSSAAQTAAVPAPAPVARSSPSRPPSVRAPQRRAAPPSKVEVVAKPSAAPPENKLAQAAADIKTGPRLTLEAVAPVLAKGPASPVRTEGADALDQALAAAARAASAAQAAASAAGAAADRVALLERTVVQLRAEAQTNQATVAQLREKLGQSQAPTPGLNNWVWPLLLTSLALGGLVVWLSWRLGRLQSGKQVAWKHAAGPSTGVLSRGGSSISSQGPLSSPLSGRRSEAPSEGQQRAGAATGPAPFLGTEVNRPSVQGGPQSTSPGALSSLKSSGVSTVPPPFSRPPSVWPMAGVESHEFTVSETAMARTEPLAALALNEQGSVRDVSIEELIDLEQQAEFFVVLGQDEAAVDLLVDHLRSTGGGSPLPYLKLLEIYSRRGDRPAYERNRARFNHRFNAYAPEWGSDLSHGRALEDYPGILPRLEQVWPRPLDAMAELEALLFRKSRGELFELPAYREVLFLYALARDLLDRDSTTAGHVDLLLPLSDGGEFSATAPAPFLEQEDFVDRNAPIDFDDRPTRPVDFDLTIPAAASIFDPIVEKLPPKKKQ